MIEGLKRAGIPEERIIDYCADSLSELYVLENEKGRRLARESLERGKGFL